MFMVNLVIMFDNKLVISIIMIVVIKGKNCFQFVWYIMEKVVGLVSLQFIIINIVVNDVSGIRLRSLLMVIMVISRKKLCMMVLSFDLVLNVMLVEL